MEQNLECETCGGTDFFKESGFYYCKECQTQSQQVQEHVFEGAATVNKKQTKKIGKDSKKEKDALTSWECYNIILKGLTDELIKCGAKPALKKVVKSLFMRYLHLSQVFEPKKDTNPRLNLLTSRHDIAVVYGIKKRKKRKRTSSDSNSTYSRASSIRQRTKKKMALIKSEYNELTQNSTQDTYLSETSLTDLKSGSEKVEKPKKIKFNVASKKHLRKVMTNAHFNKHSTDFRKELTCHKLTYQNKEKSSKRKIHSFTIAILYYLLYLGLLIVRDNIQLGDILRFVREGHLSFGAYFHLFPEECQEKKLYVPRFKQKLSLKVFREKTAEVAHFLGVEKYIEPPDLISLCERYVKELNLPREILTYVEKFILLSAPKLSFTEKSRFMPNYEARALCFIIFTLKLFFGLDGKSEFKISEQSKHFENIFNFEKWLTYLKYRKLVLEKYHFPTTLDNDSSEIDSDMLLKYLKTQSLDYKQDNKFKQLEVRDYYQVLEKLKNIPSNFGSFQSRQRYFEPSLTPFLSYVQDKIQQDFTQDSLNFILEPSHYLEKLKEHGEQLDFGLNENLIYEKVFYFSESKGRTAERLNSKNVIVKISNEEIYNKNLGGCTSKSTDVESSNENLSSWMESNKFTFERNRRKLNMPQETKHFPFERFWLNFPVSPANFFNLSNVDSHKIFEKLPFSFKIILEEGCRMLEQDFVSFYSEYLQTELILVYKEDLYLKYYNKIKRKDRNFKLALKGCVERW